MYRLCDKMIKLLISSARLSALCGPPRFLSEQLFFSNSQVGKRQNRIRYSGFGLAILE